MLLEESQKSLAELLLATAKCEKQVEKSRQVLSNHPEFSVHTTFELLDSKHQGKISISDLKAFLSTHSSTTALFLSQLISQYNSKDSTLTQAQFRVLIVPTESNLNSKPKSSPSTTLNSLLVKHIQLESNWQGQLQTNKRKLFSQNDFSVIGAFRSLYPTTDGFIGPAAIRDFFKKFHKDVTSAVCQRIVKRIDKDQDGRVNYEDFMQFVLPDDKKVEVKKKNVPRAQTRDGSRRGMSEKRPVTRVQVAREIVVEDSQDLKEILKVFCAQIKIDSEIERFKTQLVAREEFSCSGVFKWFDKDRDGFVDVSDVQCALRELQVAFHVDEVCWMVKRFSTEGKLNLGEFKGLVLPWGFEGRDAGGRVSGDVMEDLARVLKATLRSEIYAEGLRKKVRQDGLIEFDKAFQKLDWDQDGVVSILDLEKSFGKLGVSFGDGDLNRLVKRYSKSYDCRIVYSEFLKELTPK